MFGLAHTFSFIVNISEKSKAAHVYYLYCQGWSLIREYFGSLFFFSFSEFYLQMDHNNLSVKVHLKEVNIWTL